MDTTFEDLCREAISKGTELRVVPRQDTSDSPVVIYAHPLGVDGMTLDYEVHGDTLVNTGGHSKVGVSHDFGWAIGQLHFGRRVRRSGWNGKGIFIELMYPSAVAPDKPAVNGGMTHPYIFIDTTGLQTDNPAAPKDRVPWLASQTDMLATDWEIVCTCGPGAGCSNCPKD